MEEDEWDSFSTPITTPSSRKRKSDSITQSSEALSRAIMFASTQSNKGTNRESTLRMINQVMHMIMELRNEFETWKEKGRNDTAFLHERVSKLTKTLNDLEMELTNQIN